MMKEEKSARRVKVSGTGSYLPEKRLTNHDLAALVDTSDEWIRTRTGISERRIAADEEVTSDMAAEAARAALKAAGVAADAVDLIIVATITPDMVFPNTACFVQSKIGATKAFCFDIEAACSGFLYAMETARQFIAGGSVNTALVIGAEKLSCVTDWEDRGTCVLFGDGAGAVVLQPTDEDVGILSASMGSDGTLAELLSIPGGGSRHPVSAATIEQRLHYMQMNGREVFKNAVRCMCEAGQNALDTAGVSIDQVKWVIPHQANMRIIQAIADRFNLSVAERFCVNLDAVGNTSAASVPLAFDQAVRSGRIKHGDTILFIVFGGGFTWGASVLKW